MSSGWDWHIRWRRTRRGLARFRPKPAGPGARVRGPSRRKLAAIERALVADMPALSTKFALFNHLTNGERPVGVERLSASAWPRPRPAHLAVLLALVALVTMCITLSAQFHPAVRPCAAASAWAHGRGCPAYSTTRQ
jgi:hypothetical protein